MDLSLIQKENEELDKRIDTFLSTVPSKSKDINFKGEFEKAEKDLKRAKNLR